MKIKLKLHFQSYSAPLGKGPLAIHHQFMIDDSRIFCPHGVSAIKLLALLNDYLNPLKTSPHCKGKTSLMTCIPDSLNTKIFLSEGDNVQDVISQFIEWATKNYGVHFVSEQAEIELKLIQLSKFITREKERFSWVPFFKYSSKAYDGAIALQHCLNKKNFCLQDLISAADRESSIIRHEELRSIFVFAKSLCSRRTQDLEQNLLALMS